MKSLLRIMLCIFALFKMSFAFAAVPGIYCLDNMTGEWLRIGAGNTTMTRVVTVGNQQIPSAGLGNSRDRVFELSPIFLQCRNSFEDTGDYQLRFTLVTRNTNAYSPGFMDTSTNTIIYAWGGNTSFNPANSRFIVNTPLPARNSLGTTVLNPSIVIYRRTTSNIVPAGTFVGTLQFTVAKNNVIQNGQTLDIRLVTTNDLIFQPEFCTINNDQPIEVDFGTIGTVEISSRSGLDSAVTRNLELNYQCEDNITSLMRVQLVGQPSAFSTTAVEARTGNVYGTGTPIQNLGVEFYRDSTVLSPNSGVGYTTQITNGFGSDTLIIAPVKSTIANEVNLPAGYFNATATLVFTTP
ncbi:hypothetical protein B9T31_03445 [Acinetobacter sp. ANC 4558]|uniref:fimbrial protein n=1 Tax=Acinetobacter sp. ANC 4558 TaxID=1977876 RepID=UPI000A358C74|nr:fimbrial protein [Acinetobacter sp. ANC 4558]OTG87568.1 hypothetical protein B9T31_03445 [Acinetobacter sp. ANC 4558]